MFTHKNFGFIGLVVVLSACGGSDRTSADNLFDTSRQDVVAFENEGTETGLFNKTHFLKWDYEAGYTGYEPNGTVEFGPLSSIPAERLEAYLMDDQTAEHLDALANTGGGGGGGFMCPWPIPGSSSSCDANYCCTTTHTCFTTSTYCSPRFRR
jgi:hypothetical protein